jgi:DNA-binding NtrC family response regulator
VRAATILVVDDDPDVADVVATALSMTGHAVQTVGGGDEALEELASRPYDLIISDVRMRRIDGPTLYDRVVWEYPSLRRRFIFVSGYLSLPWVQAFLTTTGAPALAKPFDVLILQRTVDAMLELDSAGAPGPSG